MNTQKVVVNGNVDQKKILKKIKKRTGKKAEILTKTSGGGNDVSNGDDRDMGEELLDGFDMFSDENPNFMCVIA